MVQDTLLVVAAAMIRDGRVLVQQRPAGKAMAGLWEFPGGKVEAGEQAGAALARELREELGIEAEERALVPLTFAVAAIGERPLVLLLFRTNAWSGEPRALEAPAIRWVTAGELRALPMPPADVPLVEALAPLLLAG